MLKVFDFGTSPVRTVRRGLLEELPAGTPIMVGGLRGRAFELLRERLAKAGQRHGPAAGRPDRAGQSRPAGGWGGAGRGECHRRLVEYRRHRPDGARDGHLARWRAPPGVLVIRSSNAGRLRCFCTRPTFTASCRRWSCRSKSARPPGRRSGRSCRTAPRAGRLLGRPAQSFGLKVVATDQVLQRERVLNVRLVQDETLAPTLVAVAVMQGMSEVSDRAAAAGRPNWSGPLRGRAWRNR